MKSIVIAGRTGKDAELRHTQDGTAVLQFSVAVDDGYGDRKKTLWFDCSLFGKRGQSLESHMRKGSQVTVSGDFSTREHDGKTYMQVRVNDLTLQGGKPSEDRAPRQEPEGSYGGRQIDLDDEVPFSMEWRG